ncbi:SCO6880 family protein [Streptomyces sp. NPDC007084]|uniref:SCO6880 family protein n=1 Tax=Streptomyces sp. NPDC007084 TaxID=3154313 RepID=UPI0034558980
MSAPVSYGGWQSERSGFMGQLSGAGFLLVAAGSGLLLLPVNLGSWAAALVCVPAALLLFLLAFGRVHGLSADEWISLAVRHQIAVATQRNVFLSGAFAPRSRTSGRQPTDLPGVLARLRFLEASDGLGGTVGISFDPLTDTYTAVARVTFPGLALVDTDEQTSRVAAWAAFLRSHCTEDSPIVRIAVHQRCLPDDGAALRSWADRHFAADAPEAAVRALTEVMEDAGPSATVRETYLSVTLSAARARFAIRSSGGGQVAAAAVLVREAHALQGGLASAGLHVVNWLAPRALAATVRTAYDPEAQVVLARRAAEAAGGADTGTGERGTGGTGTGGTGTGGTGTGGTGTGGTGTGGTGTGENGVSGTSAGETGVNSPRPALAAGVDPDLAGPAHAETTWGTYRHDGAWTVSYQVRTWPQSEVYATFLQPLLRPRANARRSLSLVYEPVRPRRARQELARERVKRDSARAFRARTGRDESEDERREASVARAQDVARASGQGVVRMTAAIAVTVTDPRELETACAELQADAAAAGLEVRRIWGAQDVGFSVAALPLAQGLPERRAGF